MQLVAYGAQDIYLTGNPQMTFFKVVYRRHTNFAMESIEQVFDGTANFGGKVTSTISRNGDLIGRMYIEHSCKITHNTVSNEHKNSLGNVEHYGHSLIKDCTIEIGGQQIDKYTSMWYRVWSDLTEFNPTGYFGQSKHIDHTSNEPDGNGTFYQLMTSNGLGLNNNVNRAHFQQFTFTDSDSYPQNELCNNITYNSGDSSVAGFITINKTFLPLQFWFNKNPGLALPLIALQYHEVKIIINFESISNLIRSSNDHTKFGENTANGKFAGVIESNDTTVGNEVTISDKIFKLWVDYIYLDTDERRRFAQISHEYLIEQLQYEKFNVSSPNINLNLKFNHPVKEIIWTTRNETISTDSNKLGGRNQVITTAFESNGDYTSSPGVSLDEMGGNFYLKINGHDRFAKRDSKYFTRTQVWQHHTGYGATPTYGKTVAFLHGHSSSSAQGHGRAFKQGNDSIAVYSFAIKPEDHHPSGTCNFSRIDNAELCIEDLQVFTLRDVDDTDTDPALVNVGQPGCTDIKITVFAKNYNVLRIMSGMAGLAYSN